MSKQSDIVDNQSNNSTENRSKMMQRHKLERRDLEKQIKNIDKKLPKTKRQEIAQTMTAELENRQKEELSKIEISIKDDDLKPEINIQYRQGPSKAQRRREKLQKQEEEQDNLIVEQSKHRSEYELEVERELDQINQNLCIANLQLINIKADGNCLFRSLIYQIRQLSRSIDIFQRWMKKIPQFNFNYQNEDKEDEIIWKLRKATSEYLKKNRAEYEGFIYSLDTNAFDSKEEGVDQFDDYCNKLAETPMYTGQLEIIVHQASPTPLVFEGHTNSQINSEDDKKQKDKEQVPIPTLHITFHELLYSQGGHFNSTALIE